MEKEDNDKKGKLNNNLFKKALNNSALGLSKNEIQRIFKCLVKD